MQQPERSRILGYAMVGTVVLGGLSYFAYNLNQQLKRSRQDQFSYSLIPDDVLIAFLKDLKSQSYPHFYLVSNIVAQVEKEVSNPQEVEVVRSRIIPEVQKLFQKKQNMVLGKYQYSLEDFTHCLQNSENPRVISLYNEYIKLYDDSLLGKSPVIKLTPETIQNFDEEKIKQITEKVLQVSVKMIAQAVEELNNEIGVETELKIEKPEFIKKLNQIQFASHKRQIYLDCGMAKYETQKDELGEPNSPSEIFAKLSQYHKNNNQGFKQDIKILEDDYEKIIQKLMKKEINPSDYEAEINKIEKNVKKE